MMRDAMKNSILICDGKCPKFDARSYVTGEKEQILRYLKSFEPFAVAGMVYDCVTAQRTNIENVGYTDGEFLWSTQDIYHLEHYDAALSDDFYSKILQ